MNLRFIERDGKKILQQQAVIHNQPIYESGKPVWQDVPIVKEEKKIELTESEFDKAFSSVLGHGATYLKDNLKYKLFGNLPKSES
jgi:hypothetical protein